MSKRERARDRTERYGAREEREMVRNGHEKGGERQGDTFCQQFCLYLI